MVELRVLDFIFPIVTATAAGSGGKAFKAFCGSGFLLGSRGWALTATHVARSDLPDEVGALFVEKDQWVFIPFEARETLPGYDITVLHLPDGQWKSPLRLRNRWEGPSARYEQFGYPEDALYDIVDPATQRVVPRPDMVFVSGYIRRRISRELLIPDVVGDQFFEVSELAGQGCSGGPLFIKNSGFWDVIGIYVGERVIEGGLTMAYALREEAFRNWVPNILGHSLLEESQTAVVDISR